MPATFYTLLSAFFGVMTLASAVLTSGYFINKHWFNRTNPHLCSLFTLTFLLLILLNLNQWIAGSIYFAFFFILLIFISTFSIFKIEANQRKTVMVSLVLISITQTIVLLIFYFAAQMHLYWLLEGPNHDSLVYYQGLIWANSFPLHVSKQEVEQIWNLGVCGQGASWIGFDCLLYRGGTYSILAWLQYFSLELTGNGMYFVIAYTCLITWFSLRLLPAPGRPFIREALFVFFTLLITLSPAIIGALVNSNYATALGSITLIPIAALAIRKDFDPYARYGLMMLWIAVAAHVYPESIFYSGLFVCLIFLMDLNRNHKLIKISGILKITALMILLFSLFGNFAIIHAFNSLWAINDIPKDSPWASWYVHQNIFFWIGGFIANLIVSQKPQLIIVILAVFLTIGASAQLIKNSQSRSAILSLIILSSLAVSYIESTGYQYGEHKILHILGPVWVFFVLTASFQLFNTNKDHVLINQNFINYHRLCGIVIALGLSAIVSINAINAAFFLNNFKGAHSTDFGLPALGKHLGQKKSVVLDDTGWIGIEKFHKSHYLIMEAQRNGARLIMPKSTTDPLRGGYFRNQRQDTLRNSNGADWLIRSRGFATGLSVFEPYSISPVWQNKDYELYSTADKPFAVSGNGWFDCEPISCWTRSSFEIETYAPKSGRYELQVTYWILSPPNDGKLQVFDDKGTLLVEESNDKKHFSIELKEGWSRLSFRATWNVMSPSEMGISADQRPLFVSVKKVRIARLDGAIIK